MAQTQTKLGDLKYTAEYLAPLSTFISLYLGGIFAYFSPLFLFGFIPLLELFTPVDERNPSPEKEEEKKNKRIYDYLLYSNVPIQYVLLIYFLFRITGDVAPYEIVGMTLSMGMSCGILGINVAHELGHRIKPFEQFLAKSLLLTSLYMHFIIEHNRGHHKRVATREDPATARYGENVYAFWIRSVVNSYRSAWQLANNKRHKKNLPVISLNNEMIRFHIVQIAFIMLVGALFGWIGIIGFLGAAITGFLLLETVNYIEHYGLVRNKKANGNYERVQPCHSWNSDHMIGRITLYELTRHSDHHYLASRKYQVLRHFDESPQLPTGYPGMMLLSLFPPLWFKVMHKTISNQPYGTYLTVAAA